MKPTDGRWVTINGVHVFVKNGQSVEDASNEHKKRNSGTSARSGSIIPGKYEPPANKPVKSDYDINALTVEIESNINKASQILRQAIDSGNINTNIHQGHQDKHIPGTQNYRQELANGREPSILTADPQMLIATHAGKGLPVIRNGKWTQTERFVDKKIIGIYNNKRFKQSFRTNCGRIHYSNKGVHIVPDKEKNNEKNR